METWETEEKKEASVEFEKKVTEEADKTIDTEYEELSKEDKEAYDLKRVKIYEADENSSKRKKKQQLIKI